MFVEASRLFLNNSLKQTKINKMHYKLMLSSIRPRLGHTFIARRPGWESQKFLYFVPGSTFTVNRPPLLNIFEEGAVVNYSEHVDVHTYTDAGGHQCAVYVPTPDDLKAENWVISGGKNL